MTLQHSSLPVSASPIFRGASIENSNHIKHSDIDMVICERKQFSLTSNPKIVHRLPPIEGSGTSRLVIVLNESPTQT